MPLLPNRPPVRLHFIIVATGLVAAATALQPDPARAQSFDCRQATDRVSGLICQEPDVARLDEQLATLYREQIGKISEERQDEFRRHEPLFLNARRKCREDYRCIEQSYHNRIKEFEDLLSEARREEADSGDATAERPIRPREHRGTWSERPPEPSGSSNSTAPPTSPREARSESDTAGAAMNPAEAPYPQWAETPRKATVTSEHPSRRSRATAATTTGAPQPREAPNAAAAKHVAADRPSQTNNAPAKPTIQWIDPPPAR